MRQFSGSNVMIVRPSLVSSKKQMLLFIRPIRYFPTAIVKARSSDLIALTASTCSPGDRYLIRATLYVQRV